MWKHCNSITLVTFHTVASSAQAIASVDFPGLYLLIKPVQLTWTVRLSWPPVSLWELHWLHRPSAPPNWQSILPYPISSPQNSHFNSLVFSVVVAAVQFGYDGIRLCCHVRERCLSEGNARAEDLRRPDTGSGPLCGRLQGYGLQGHPCSQGWKGNCHRLRRRCVHPGCC